MRDAKRSTFGALLRAELMRRCDKNPSYSLRAFAKYLEIDNATLSQLIRGRREVTTETIARLAPKLGLPDTVVDSLAQEARSSRTPQTAYPSSFGADAARIVDEPLHHAILALVTAEHFRPDSRFIAQVLDTEVDAVNVAVQRLARFGLLNMESPARWRDALGTGELAPEQFEQTVWAYAAARLCESNPDSRSARVVNNAEDINMQHPVRQFQIVAKNPAVSASFYASLFGWGIDAENSLGYRQISTGPNGIVGGIWPAPPEAKPLVQLFVQVPDVRAAAERALQLGAKLILPPQGLPDGDEMALLVDPEGLSFGVYQPAASK